MHDLEYSYVKIEPLVWTPEMIEKCKADFEYGAHVLGSMVWRNGKWVRKYTVTLRDGTVLEA